jgi:hypothetical protein
MATRHSAPGPQLSLHLVRGSDFAWLAGGIVLLIAGGLAFLLRARFAEYASSAGFLGVLAMAIGSISAGIGVYWVWQACRAMTVTLGESISIGRLFGAPRQVDWSEIVEVSFFRSEKQDVSYQTEGIWPVPIPGVGAFILTTYSTKTIWLIERYVELIGSDRRPLVRIGRAPLDELQFSLWYDRFRLQQAIRSLGGSTTWDQRGLTQVSLAGARLGDQEFQPLREQLLRVRELQHLDLSGTQVTAAALQGLEQCESLAEVRAAQTRVAPAEVERLNAAFAARQSQAGFGFLQV